MQATDSPKSFRLNTRTTEELPSLSIQQSMLSFTLREFGGFVDYLGDKSDDEG